MIAFRRPITPPSVATTKTISNWGFRNDGGALVLIRPQSATAFQSGDQDIKVKVAPATGAAYTTTLKVSIVDGARTPESGHGDLITMR